MAKLPAPIDPGSTPGGPKANRRALRGRLVVGGKFQPTDRSTAKTLLAAVAVHVVVIAALVRLVSLGHGLHDWFGLAPMSEAVQERVVYVEPRALEPKPAETPPKPVAQKTVPTRVAPAVPTASTPAPAAASIPIDPALVAAGRGGDSSGTGGKPRNLGIDPALIGLAPVNADPRIWQPGSGGITVARTGQQLIDSVIGWAIASAADSLDSIARIYDTNREPADWTKRMKNGEKWGWDKTGLRLGKYTVPNVLLALLPASVQRGMSSNPVEASRTRGLLLARDDINRFSAQSSGEGDFRKALKEVRARKNREYEARSKARAAAENTKAVVVPPKSSGGSY